MGYGDAATITLSIVGHNLASEAVDSAVASLDGLTTAGDTAGQALDTLQATSEAALGGISDSAAQVVDTAGEIGPAFEEATDIDTSTAVGELEDLGDAAGDVGDDIENIDISGVFSKQNERALKNAAGILDDMAGTNLKPLVEGLGDIGDIAEPFEAQISAGLTNVMGKLGAKLAPASAAVGAVLGEAQAVAQQAAATGTAAVSGMFTKIAAMAIPLAPAGTTVGTAVGGAMASGIIAGLTGAGLALAVQSVLTDIDLRLPGDTGDDPRTDLFPDWNAVIAANREDAAAAGAAVGTAAGEAVGPALTSAGISSISGFVLNATPAATGAGTTTGSALSNAFDQALDLATPADRAMGDLAAALQGNTDVIDAAMDKVQWAIEHPMELIAQQARLQGAIQQLEYARGAEGNTDEVNQVIDEQLAALKAQWLVISGSAYNSGFNAQAAYAQGLAQFRTPRQLKVDWPDAPSRFAGKYLPGDIGRAHGGAVAGNGIYEVNEPGDPEMLTVGGRNFLLMGRESGYVDPLEGLLPGGAGPFKSAATGGGPGSGGPTINLNVNFSSLTPPTPAEGQRMAQAIVPELVREMRRQRLL